MRQKHKGLIVWLDTKSGMREIIICPFNWENTFFSNPNFKLIQSNLGLCNTTADFKSHRIHFN